MRADRLLSILLLLQVHRRLTAADLAARLGVSERTVHRDMGALSASGIPVYAERGGNGGWRLTEEYQTKLTGLTQAEIQAAFLTQPARLLADLGLRQAADAASLKLLAALPSGQRGGAARAQQTILLDMAGWRQAVESVPLLPTLHAAIWQGRRVLFAYERGDGEARERTVDPLGLVAKGRIWYLVAAVHGEVRTYRVSRMRAAQTLDEVAIRPPDFDLALFWEESSRAFVEQLPRYAVVARVAPAMLARLQLGDRVPAFAVHGPPDAEGWTTVTLQMETPDSACEYLLGVGMLVEVLEPLALREQVGTWAWSVAARYGTRDHDR
ncbi:MAG: WYL domain-containing protein [Chloroflexia bacterium]